MIMQVDKAKTLADQAKMRLDSLKKTAGKTGNNEAINKAAQEFESVFLAQMMEHMFAEVDFNPSGKGPGDDIYKSLLIDEYSKLMSRSGGIGVADHVKREMLRMQETQQVLNDLEAETSLTSPADASVNEPTLSEAK